MKTKDAMLYAMKKEIALRKDYLQNTPVRTLYFGGGTPSLLSADEIKGLMDVLNQHFDLSGLGEVTLEANPDDLNLNKLKELKEAGINRLSIGVQSFQDVSLQFINRAHNAADALRCVKEAQDAGFSNITIDLIYGIPGMTDVLWLKDLDILKSLEIPHFSAYALTVEPKTTLDNWIAKGKIEAVDENLIASHFHLLQQWCQQNEYIPYEISNYCHAGNEAKHNSSYWQAEKYIGFGPSAHSFDGDSRQWNVANNNLYINKVNSGDAFYEKEHLSDTDKCNEYVMTSLRTLSGCDTKRVKEIFGEAYAKSILRSAEEHIHTGLLQKKEDSLILTQSGKLFADRIISDLFIVEEETDATATKL
jgi:oxygen-independent coproporphyrinogen-3 oxidase